MKFDLSKLSVALMASGLTLAASTSCLAYHGNDHDSYRHAVTVPNSESQYFFSVTGLYLRATNDDLYFANKGNPALSMQNYSAIKHDFDFGGRIDAGFELNNTGNDLAANWTYLSNDKSSSESGLELRGRFFVGPVIAAPTSGKVSGSSEFTFNEFNIELGQKVDFSQLHTRFHMGLSLASLKNDFKVNVSDTNQSGTFNAVTKSFSKFQGLGPRVGVDMAYPITACNNVAVVAHAAGALLAGKLENDIDGKSAFTPPPESEGNSSSYALRTKSDDQYTIVPAATVKVGLRYASRVEPGDSGWSVEGGWQATNYVHAVSNTAGFNTTSPNTHSSYGNYGFYLTLGYAG